MSLYIYFVCQYIHRIISWKWNTCVKTYTIKKTYSYCQIALSRGFVTHTHNTKQCLHILNNKVLNKKIFFSKSLADYLARKITRILLMKTSVKFLIFANVRGKKKKKSILVLIYCSLWIRLSVFLCILKFLFCDLAVCMHILPIFLLGCWLKHSRATLLITTISLILAIFQNWLFK